jgi:outer membrane protein W
MNQAKKLVLTVIFAVAVVFSVNAQLRVGGGLMTGLPMGDFSDGYKFGIGGGVSGEYMVTENIGIGLKVGYMSYSAKNQDQAGLAGVDIEPLKMVPFYASGNYHFMPDEDLNFYGGLDLGINMISQTVTVSVPFFGTQKQEENRNEFAIVPKVGATYKLNDQLGLDFNTGYAIVGDTEYVPLNLGVTYMLEL